VVFYIGVVLYLGGFSTDYGLWQFDVANQLPAVALSVLISLTSRRMSKGMPVVAVGSLA
jgi:hypothetical protein